MESPIVVENCPHFNQPVEPNNTGFPFDDSEYDSHDRLQARLNDIAARHPEFANHFRDFDSFPSLRKRHGSGSSGDQEDRAGPSHRFANHSFPSGFNRFPFTSHFEDDEPHRENKPPEVPKHEKRGRKPNPHLPQHLSNTVDLGQKQPPVQEARSQRSMSAPPENRSQSSRFESEPSNLEDMGKSFSRQPQQQQQPQHQQQQQPKERIIPIHVEGRDDPVLPKNPNITSSNTNTEKVYSGERGQSGNYPGYGQQRQPDPHAQYRRQMYDQFASAQNKPSQYPQQQQFTRQQTPPSQQPQPQQQQHFAKQQTPPAQHHQQHQQQQQEPPQRQQATPPPAPLLNDPLDKIKSVRSDVMELMNKVERFRGTRKDREYLYLDEMLTRNLLKLDDIETEGKENIRQARKEAIKCIQTCINNLEAKAQAKEMQLKNAEASHPEQMSAEIVESQNPASEATELPKETSDAPKFVSEATLIMSPPQSKTIEQSKQKEEKMDIDPLTEKQEVVVDESKTTETPQKEENPEQSNSEKNESQISADDSSQSANQGSTEK